MEDNVWCYTSDTSMIDEVIGCANKWNPGNGKRNCLRELEGLDLPQSVDVTQFITQVLTELKDGNYNTFSHTLLLEIVIGFVKQSDCLNHHYLSFNVNIYFV